MPAPPLKVLVAGGSYGGLSAIATLLDLSAKSKESSSATADSETAPGRPFEVDIHLVDERDGFLNLIGCPLVFASRAYAANAWIPYKDCPGLRHPNLRITRGSFATLDPDAKVARIRDLDSKRELQVEYDYFIAATGLRRVYPVVPQSLTRDAYLLETSTHVQALERAADAGVVVIGGGAVGIEMAAELKLVHPGLEVTLVHSRDVLLSSEPLPVEVQAEARRALEDAGVSVRTGQRVSSVEEVKRESDGKAVKQVKFQDDSVLTAGHVISAISKMVPSTEYLPAAALTGDGYVKIDELNRFLPSHRTNAHHLAIGDIVSWSGIKRCGAAMAAGKRVATNLHTLETLSGDDEQPELEILKPIPPLIALAVGTTAVTYAPWNGVRNSAAEMEVFFQEDLWLERSHELLGLNRDWSAGSKV